MSTRPDPELEQLREQLQASAPPGFYVADLWRCRGHCEDVHALVLADDRAPRTRAQRAERGARGRGAGRRRG